MASKAPFVVFTILLASLMLASAKDKDKDKIKDNTSYAVQFTGNQYVKLPSMTVGNSFSVEFLVRWRSGDSQVLYMGTNNKEKIGVRIVTSTSFSAYVVLDLCDKTGTCSSAMSDSAVIPANQWIYVAITAAAEPVRTLVSFYTQAASDANPTKINTTPINCVTPGVSRTNAAIGYDPSANNKWLNSDIDEVRIWTTSSIAVSKDFKGSLKDKTLLAFYSFEEGSGYSASDSSKSGNDATLGSKKNNAPTWIGAGFGQDRSCSVWGRKTWVKTFDRYVYGQTGWNTYVLAQGASTSLLNMQIKVDDNTLGRGNAITGVAWKYQGDLVVLDLDYRTASTQRVLVNNQTRTEDLLTFSSGLAISKQYSGNKLVFNIQANNDWSMKITSKVRQASTSVSLKLPEYQWKSAGVSGICGNYDGLASNDNNLAGNFIVASSATFFATPTASGSDGITCVIPSSSPLYTQANSVCNNPAVIPDDFSDSCFFDICATQDIGAASVVAQTAYDTCLEENGANTTTGNPCVTPCPGFCSFQGTCNSDGTCTCYSGYGGADCSQQASYKCYTASWASGSFPLTPFIGNGDVNSNYKYEQPLTHSANSGNEISDSSVFYLYQKAGDANALSLVWINDKPRDGSGGSMSATFTTANKNTNQALAVTLKVKDDSSSFDTYDTATTGKITAKWKWDACCTDGLAFTGNNLQTTPFCMKVSVPSVSGISQIYATSQNLFGEQDIQYVPLSDRSSLQICGDTCTNPCGQYSSCNTCQSNSQCGWCADSGTCELGTAGGPNSGRCSLWRYNYTRSRVVTANPSYPIDPSDIQVYMGAQNLNANFFVNLPDPANVPLEVVIVQELTNSLLFDLISLKLIVPLVIDGILNEYSNARIAFATFSDKPVAPYGAPNKDWAFNSHIKLTSDMSAVKKTISGITTLNGGDSLNSQMDALLIAAASDMGWSENARRVVLLITKSGYHTPTGTFARPNNADGFVDANEDYPTTQQVYNTLLNNNVVPIFLTTDSLAKNVYGPLVDSWGFGSTITYSLFSMPDQVTSALDAIGGNVAAFIQTPGRVTSVSAPYYGVSPLSRVAFTATVSATSTSTDTAVIVVPGFGKVTISSLSDDAPSTIACGASPISCSNSAVISLRGISSVYGDKVRAQIMSVPSVGKLYQFGTSTVINANDFVSDPGLQVVYDPQGNCAANFTATFNYRIVDTCSVCSAVDSCGVVVVGMPPIYPPPIATPPGPLVTPLDNISDPYPLNGTGIGGSGFLRSFVHDLPLIGTLLQADGVTPIDVSLPVPGGVVVYKPPPGLDEILDNWDGNSKRAGGTSLTSFSYTVQDTRTGSSSSPAGVNVVAQRPQQTTNTANNVTFTCQEDTVCTITLSVTGTGQYTRLQSLPWYVGQTWTPSSPLLGKLSTCPDMSCPITAPTDPTGDLGTRTLYYLPPKDYASGASIYFSWTVCSPCSVYPGFLTMYINASNDAPVTTDVAISAAENSAGNVINLNGTDVDAGDQLLYFIDTWNGVGGTLFLGAQQLGTQQNNVLDSQGQLTFTPTPNTFGTVSFTYYVKDFAKVRSTPSSTVTIQVTRVSYPATASAPSTVSSSQLNYTTIHLSGANVNGDATLSIILDQAPASGILYNSGMVPLSAGDTIASATGANVAADVIFYTAGTSSDLFKFHVNSSSDASSAQRTVNVNVVPLPLPTLVQPVNSFSFDQETNYTVTFQATSANSPNATYYITHLPQNVEIHQVDASGNDAGVYTVNSAISNSQGQVLFVGLYGKFGSDSFTWMATDGAGISSGTQTVPFTVNFVNHAPVAQNNPDVTVAEDGSVVIPLVANDRDAGAVLTYAIQASLSGSAGGVLEVCATAQCTSVTGPATAGTTVGSAAVRYTPAVHTWGSASFTFKATDQYNAPSNDATVTITVQKVLYRPFVVTSNQSATLNDADAGIFLYLNGSDYNYPRSALGFVINNPALRGKLYQVDKTTQITTSNAIFEPQQAVWYVPNLNIQPYSPYDIISYQIVNLDGLLSEAVGTYNVFVTHTYLAPVAYNATVTAASNGQNVAITLQAYDPNGQNENLVAFIQTPTAVFPLVDATTQATLVAGSEVSSPAAGVIYTPQNFTYGSPLDSFSFYVRNPTTGLNSQLATVQVNIPRGWHNPVWVDPHATVTEDTPTVIQLTGYDPDGDALTCKWGGGNTHGSWYEYDMATGSIIQPALQNGDPFVFWPCYAKYFPDLNWDGLTGNTQTQVNYNLFKSSFPSFASGMAPFTVTMVPVPDPPVVLFNRTTNGTIQFSNIGLNTQAMYPIVLFDPDSPPVDPIRSSSGDWYIHFNQRPTFGELFSFPDQTTNGYNNLSSSNLILSNQNMLTSLDAQNNLIPYWTLQIAYGLKEQNYGHEGTDFVSFYITDSTNLRSEDITYTFVISGTTTVPVPLPVDYTLTLNEGVGNVGVVKMNATDVGSGISLRYVIQPTAAWSAAFKTPSTSLTFLPNAGVSFTVNTTNADFNTGSGSTPLVACYQLFNRITNAYYRGGAWTCSMSFYILPVNDDPTISSSQTYSSAVTTRVITDVLLRDVDCTTGDQVCGAFNLELTVQEGASVATISKVDTAGVTCSGSNVHLVCVGTLENLNNMLSPGAGLTVTAVGSRPLTAHITVNVFDNGNVGSVFRNGTATQTLTVQFTTQQAGSTSQKAPLSASLVGGTTLISSSLYGLYRLMRKRKLLPEDANPWETDDAFDNTNDNPLFTGMPTTSAATTVTMVAN